jgi:Tol biopolymer transport system component
LLRTDANTASWSADSTAMVICTTGRKVQIVPDILGVDGRKVQVLNNEGMDAIWGPQGDRIAYVRGPRNQEEVWLCEAGDCRKVADGGYPHWSADGKTLYFHSTAQHSVMALSIDEAQAQPRKVYPMPWHLYPVVSPDGHQIAYFKDKQLRVDEITSGKRLWQWEPTAWSGMLPAWSPDSQWLAFGSYALSDADKKDAGLWLLNMKTGQISKIIGGPYTRPAWSWDGEQLAFIQKTRNQPPAAYVLPTGPLLKANAQSSLKGEPGDVNSTQ